MGSFVQEGWQRLDRSLRILFLPKFLLQVRRPEGCHVCDDIERADPRKTCLHQFKKGLSWIPCICQRQDSKLDHPAHLIWSFSLHLRLDGDTLPRFSAYDLYIISIPNLVMSCQMVRGGFQRRGWFAKGALRSLGRCGFLQCLKRKDATFLLTVGSFLLTVGLLCLRLCSGAFPLAIN